ncbi:MAG: hypothetical protein IJ196_06220 [Prevotella sp.]|nr:hypothetical protein [Prevotella sp.]
MNDRFERNAALATVKDYERIVEKLQRKKAQGYTEMTIQEYNGWFRAMRRAGKAEHERKMAMKKQQREETLSFWRGQLYDQYDSSLRDMKNHPDKYLDTMDGDDYMREMENYQKKMDDLRKKHKDEFGTEPF